ncbi:MAG: hypothetical protein WBF34_22560 [Streptosporangiaceae bacterium]
MGKFATGQLLVFGVALAGPGQEIESGKAVPEPAWVLCQRGCQPLDGCRARAITSTRKRLGRLPSRAQKAGMRPDLTAHLTATASGRGEPSDAACPAAGGDGALAGGSAEVMLYLRLSGRQPAWPPG